MRPTVVWDVDDVLNDLTAAWLAQVWAPAHPDRKVAYADLRSNPPNELLGIDRATYLASLDSFRLGDGYAAMPPNAHIIAWFEANVGACDHVALTGTALRAAPLTAMWVLRHFGRWIREFAFVPAERAAEVLPRYDADKGAWLARLSRPAVLVDDAPSNLVAARMAGAAAIRWPQPWNGGGGTYEGALIELDRWLAASGSA